MNQEHILRKNLRQVSLAFFLMGLFIIFGSWILSKLLLNESQLTDLASWTVVPSIIAVIFCGIFGFAQGQLWIQRIRGDSTMEVMTDSISKERRKVPTSYKEFVLVVSALFVCYLLANLIITKDIVLAVISSARLLIPFGIGNCVFWGLVNVRLFFV